MGRGVDEVRVGDEGGREANDGPVEAHDENLGMRVEGLGNVQIEGDEGAQPELADVCFCFGGVAGDGDIGATGMEGGC